MKCFLKTFSYLSIFLHYFYFITQIVESLVHSLILTFVLSFIHTLLVSMKGSGQDQKAFSGLALFPVTLYNL